jgi:tetratricopeptide (TPR) repeat protein
MVDVEVPGEAEAFSLFGEPLFRSPLRPETLEAQTGLYEEALRVYEASPDDVDSLVWRGRRTAYLGRYREAAAVFSVGVERFPDEPKFLRHRGHRFISLRRFDLAIDDLARAAELVRGMPDEVEPDGMPNERGIPVSSLHFNIWYHLGLAHYLSGDLEGALEAYRECMSVSEIPDKRVATAHWLYMTLRRLGRVEEAEAALEGIDGEMDIIENQSYHDCLMMYLGEATPEALLEEARGAGALGLVTTGYGVACWYLYSGSEERGVAVLREILASGAWAGFGYIAAEADLHRLGLEP